MLNEEQKETILLREDNAIQGINANVPYMLLKEDITEEQNYFFTELSSIIRYYNIYKNGIGFVAEGTNSDYVASDLHYKMCASLIDTEARFLFSETPTIMINPKGDTSKVTDEVINAVTNMNDLIKTVLDANKFEEKLIKSAKDCFIGKRVAILANFNNEDGVMLTFIPSTQFYYETKITNQNVISKFVCFYLIKNGKRDADKRYFKKKYELINNEVYLTESIYDGLGNKVEEIIANKKILLSKIPVAIVLNDGLSGEELGESEIELLKNYEKYYSKLANADIDAERKSMNPVKYTVDMDNNSTKNLSTAAGAYWDLGSDQNLDNAKPQIGMLEPAMNYTTALKSTLDRIKTTGYEQIDVPNITLETMVGSITSGKALKAIYWQLIVRCKEKMKSWSPQLKQIIEIIIEGAQKYPECVKRYISEPVINLGYEIEITHNIPLPEDEVEARQIDLSQVEAQTMSKKTYMKKWLGLTDEEADEEIKQIALERQVIEDSFYK